MQLLLVHGIGSNSRNWRSLMPALAASREVIAVNLPGHGKTMWGEPDEVVRLIRETVG